MLSHARIELKENEAAPLFAVLKDLLCARIGTYDGSDNCRDLLTHVSSSLQMRGHGGDIAISFYALFDDFGYRCVQLFCAGEAVECFSVFGYDETLLPEERLRLFDERALCRQTRSDGIDWWLEGNFKSPEQGILTCFQKDVELLRVVHSCAASHPDPGAGAWSR